MALIYQEIPMFNEDKITEILQYGSNEDKSELVLSLSLYQYDIKKTESIIKLFLTGTNEDMARVALVALGHVIRLNGHHVDIEKWITIFKSLPSKNKLQGQFDEVLEDYEIFVKRKQPA
ncbi:hypothetical protein [Wielerella bovis]|uniref:hypothetical protein n=1 Tax=Wielerella bovis TaxID=2917790 RepID=UPI002019639B|nr:hypothetical protein [Wielerella bovis]ULJ64771.1 hypothetical protein MIS33_00110 [Wielerella bovis]ULJ67043.1 hypothetical protein MIS31_00110 [Wielerella bovis]ULJ69357.1 hypothetical protein MIS45_00275 [Wielerella bovis]